LTGLNRETFTVQYYEGIEVTNVVRIRTLGRRELKAYGVGLTLAVISYICHAICPVPVFSA
jgi:hypothetical protein